jgi:hypothetical protein
MDESNVKNVVEAAKELGEAYEETEGLLSGFTESLKAAENLYGSGNQGTGAALVSLGVALIVFPEPTFISDVTGCGIVAAGLAYQKLVPPPLSVDDIYSSIEDQMRELGIGQRILAQPLDLDKIKPPCQD